MRGNKIPKQLCGVVNYKKHDSLKVDQTEALKEMFCLNSLGHDYGKIRFNTRISILYQ